MATKSTFTTELDAIRANAITLDSDDAILAKDWASIDTEYKAKLAIMHTINTDGRLFTLTLQIMFQAVHQYLT